MVGKELQQGEYEVYLSSFPDVRVALEYADSGLTHFALGELDRVRRKNSRLKGTGIEGFLHETERRICVDGINYNLTLAQQEKNKGDDPLAGFYAKQAKEFAKIINMDIEHAIQAALKPLKRK